MSVKEKVSLCLKNFETNTKKYWQNFHFETDFYDVTLACGDKYIKAHKIVIAAHSIVLKNILRLYPNQNQLIYLRGIDYRDLENIVSFVYGGQIEIDKDDLEGFLGVAEELKIKGIIDLNGQSTSLSLQSANHIEKSTENVNMELFQESSKQADTPTIENLKEFDVLELLDLPSISIALCDKDQTDIENDSKNIKNDMLELERKNIHEPIFQDYDKNTFLSSDLPGNNTELSKIITKSKESQNKLVSDIPTSTETRIRSDTLGRNVVPMFLDNDNPLITDDESNKFGENRNLREQTQLFHEIVEYKCDQCDYKGKNEMCLKDHIKMKHTNGYFPCDQCTYEATTLTVINNHTARVHVPYKCEKCDLTVLGRQRLKRHKEKHKGINYQCNKCASIAKTNGDHKRHMRVIHGDVCFMCDQCEYKSKTTSNLKQHMESIHLGIRYPCNQCDYQAPEKRLLRSHLEKRHPKNVNKNKI